MVNINAVIAVVGATVLLLSTAGLMEIRSRAGPFEEPLVPAAIPFTMTGSYTATGPRGTQGPNNVCVPPPGETQCGPARLRVELSVTGLPSLPPRVTYQAFLLGPELLSLGALVASMGKYSLIFDEALDGRQYRELLITVETRPAATPTGIELVSFDVAGEGQATPASLSGAFSATPASRTGSVRAAEIGAFSKSTTAVGELRGVPRFEAWSYHAWFVTNDGVYIPLGAWDVDDADPTRATLDGRVEKIRLEDQRLFLTTLEPAGAEPSEAPTGLPAFVIDFTRASKAMG